MPTTIKDGVTIKTNGHERDLIDVVFDDSEGWREARTEAEFDTSEQGFIYRGSVYAISEFTVAGDDLKARGWDGVQGESYFSAVVIQLFDLEGNYRDEGVVVGYAHW